ncbi:MAG TPA: PP2C family protein-serine/threonine phosphatase [Flavobacteriales bacterium]|nr:PP2C family protein-serine/threonine phosphatase [Flavobacteriales bacterium]HMR27122.1 PP2C family protein-serine/threonine phosphatase [Flavobacteriales bacterium]
MLLVLFATLLTVGLALVVWSHSTTRRTLRHEAVARLSGITGTLATAIEGGRVTRLMEKYDSRGMLLHSAQDPWYYVLHENLRKPAEANRLSMPLRLVAYDDRKHELQVMVTSASTPALREPYTGPDQAAIIAAITEGRIDPGRVLRDDQVAAFDAVRNARGKVVAALVAELPTAELDALAMGRLWRHIGLLVLALVLVGGFLMRFVGGLVRREEEARSALQQRHDGVTDSIAYAGKIQSALIPRPERYGELFDDHFVLNRPKDVVSGDFHWVHRLSEHVRLVAQADCTGHGLPGAMMAAIGCSLLNELVMQHPDKDPAELLALLNQRMVHALNQRGERLGAGDGMDIALCRVDREQREILFAGAFRPLYWMHDGQLTVINGDRRPIGGNQHDADRRFTVHRLAYHAGDRIYLFSDGYVDQFGGPDGRKLMATRFSAILEQHQHLPLALQAEELERAFDAWKGAREQMDDVCVLGLAV